MASKINISQNGKTFKMESDDEGLIGKKIGETLSGNELSNDLNGYDLEIRGTSDKAGFPGKKEESGPLLRKVMFTKGKFLHKVKGKGFRKKKSVRGNEISTDIVQINLAVVKEGAKPLNEVLGKKEEVKAE